MGRITWPLTLLALGVLACARGGAPAPAPSGEVTGTVRYLDRSALPPGATVTVQLRDVSLADAPAELLAEQVLRPTTQAPFAFVLRYDAARIDARHEYAVSARIEVDGALRYISDTRIGVVTRGNPSRDVEVTVRRVGGT
jgi:putative lipoprotein